MTIIQHNNMIQTISPDAADDAFHKCILPRASRRGEYLFDIHAFYAFLELASIDSISVPQ